MNNNSHSQQPAHLHDHARGCYHVAGWRQYSGWALAKVERSFFCDRGPPLLLAESMRSRFSVKTDAASTLQRRTLTTRDVLEQLLLRPCQSLSCAEYCQVIQHHLSWPQTMTLSSILQTASLHAACATGKPNVIKNDVTPSSH